LTRILEVMGLMRMRMMKTMRTRKMTTMREKKTTLVSRRMMANKMMKVKNMTVSMRESTRKILLPRIQ
jgi:hypothetical protein